jgi:hypothetical protein
LLLEQKHQQEGEMPVQAQARFTKKRIATTTIASITVASTTFARVIQIAYFLPHSGEALGNVVRIHHDHDHTVLSRRPSLNATEPIEAIRTKVITTIAMPRRILARSNLRMLRRTANRCRCGTGTTS